MPLLPSSLFRHLGLPARETMSMPARVAELVVKEEESSERLIGWVQLAIVSTFAALYMIAPRPTDAMDALLEPVPLVIGAFLLFTVLRLVAAYRGFLPGWLLVLSMLMDVALLYALIWTFHLTYAQPETFYLKAPTFMYIFVFIAVRALRFDPRFVLSIGVFAAVGWLFMVVYAVDRGGAEVITRSFVTYLTSNMVLIGAEFDKIFTILVLTAVLALALFRARRTLLTAVRESQATADMRRFFGTGVADAITSSESVMAGSAKDCDAAILMLDLRGFSSFAATRTPHEVVAILTAYHRMVVPVIEREGGIVDKFLGDGVMATFGAVRPVPQPAASALRALDGIMAQRQAWQAHLSAAGIGDPLTVNGAAVAGRVVAATLGSEDRLEFTVIGAAANLAAKLEKHNKAMGTAALTTSETYAQAVREGYTGALDELGATSVPGVDGTIHLVRVG
jgi:adenylate cyclase